MTRDTMLAVFRRFKLKLEVQMASKDSELSKLAAEVKVISSGVSVTLSYLTRIVLLNLRHLHMILRDQKVEGQLVRQSIERD